MPLNNPSLYEEPLSQKNLAARSRPELSVLDWLEQSGRLVKRDQAEKDIIIDGGGLDEIGEIDEFATDDVSDFDDEDEGDDDL